MSKNRIDLKFMEIPPGTAPNLMVHDITLDAGDYSKVLDLYQSKVGGSLQLISLTENCGLYINEKRETDQHRLNKVATLLAERHIPDFTKHDFIVGTALLVGLDDDECKEVSAPMNMMYDCLRICRMIREIVDAGKISGVGSDTWTESLTVLVKELTTTGTKPPNFEGSFEWN